MRSLTVLHGLCVHGTLRGNTEQRPPHGVHRDGAAVRAAAAVLFVLAWHDEGAAVGL